MMFQVMNPSSLSPNSYKYQLLLLCINQIYAAVNKSDCLVITLVEDAVITIHDLLAGSALAQCATIEEGGY
jgi:hypothetical protein